MTASELVNITHKENSPWSKTDKGSEMSFLPIKLETVKKYHKYETI